MKYRIVHERDHYVLYLNGAFFGSYDTVNEAIDDIECFMANNDNRIL